MAFIDYKKTFNCVSHENIWESLRSQGVHKEYIDGIIYTRTVEQS